MLPAQKIRVEAIGHAMFAICQFLTRVVLDENMTDKNVGLFITVSPSDVSIAGGASQPTIFSARQSSSSHVDIENSSSIKQT